MKSVKVKLGLGAVLLVIVLFFVFCVRVVPTGHVGVRVRMSETNLEQYYTEGWGLKSPFERVVKMSIQDNDDIVLPETEGTLKGQERVYMQLKAVVRLDPEKAADVYHTTGSRDNYISKIMPNALIYDVVKGSVAQYTAEEFASKRVEVMASAQAALNAKVQDRGITVVSLSLENYNFTPEMEKAIHELGTLRIEKDIQVAQNEKDLAKAQNDKLVAETNADAQAMIVKKEAEAEAEAITVKANAQAEANRKLAESMTPELIEYKKVETWNGKNPSVLVTDGDSSVPIVYTVPEKTE